jgi:hypothetical protein
MFDAIAPSEQFCVKYGPAQSMAMSVVSLLNHMDQATFFTPHMAASVRTRYLTLEYIESTKERMFSKLMIEFTVRRKAHNMTVSTSDREVSSNDFVATNKLHCPEVILRVRFS